MHSNTGYIDSISSGNTVSIMITLILAMISLHSVDPAARICIYLYYLKLFELIRLVVIFVVVIRVELWFVIYIYIYVYTYIC